MRSVVGTSISATSFSRSARSGCGCRPAVSPSSRISATTRRISASALVPVVRIEPSALRTYSGSSSAFSAAPACTTMTLIECATMSCSSRAIRARSSDTACSACSRLVDSARTARSASASARRSKELHEEAQAERHRADHPVEDDLARVAELGHPQVDVQQRARTGEGAEQLAAGRRRSGRRSTAPPRSARTGPRTAPAPGSARERAARRTGPRAQRPADGSGAGSGLRRPASATADETTREPSPRTDGSGIQTSAMATAATAAASARSPTRGVATRFTDPE